MVIGTPDSWGPSVAISNKDYRYQSSTWSPCGQSIAARTEEVVEVRDALTSELLSALRPPGPTSQLKGPLAHSPDGRSLCGVSGAAIIIWDIQTGGVAKEFECGYCLSSLVWSLDGRTIGAIFKKGDNIWSVFAYDIASGKKILRGALGSVDEPHVRAHGKSFRVMKAYSNNAFECTAFGHPSDLFETHTINILGVGAALTQVRSSPLSVDRNLRIKSFSPITHHVRFRDL